MIGGLKINKETAKVIKIEGGGDNGTNSCKELTLDWTQEFISLGIAYNADKFEDITDINIENKSKKFKN